MILELYIIIFISMIIFFTLSYFSKNEILWGITMLLSGLVMISSYKIEVVRGAEIITLSYPYMMGIGLIFFVLSLILGLIDLFDKYSLSVGDNKWTK